jgi:hypothetical protein
MFHQNDCVQPEDPVCTYIAMKTLNPTLVK